MDNTQKAFEKLTLPKLLLYIMFVGAGSIGTFFVSWIARSDKRAETKQDKTDIRSDSTLADVKKERDYFKNKLEEERAANNEEKEKNRLFLLKLWEESKEAKKHAKIVDRRVDRVESQANEKIGNITEKIEALPKSNER